jgi:hypothetical protein
VFSESGVKVRRIWEKAKGNEDFWIKNKLMSAFFFPALRWSSGKRSGTTMPLFQDINEKSPASQLSGSRAFVCPAFVSLEAMRRLNF